MIQASLYSNTIVKFLKAIFILFLDLRSDTF